MGPTGPKCVALLAGERVASGLYDYSLRVWDLASGIAHVLEGHSGTVESIVALVDNRVASASDAKTSASACHQEHMSNCRIRCQFFRLATLWKPIH